MKRLLALLLALSMSMGLISCGNSIQTTDENGKDVDFDSATSQHDTAPQDEGDTEEDEEEEDGIDWTVINPLTGEPSEKDYSKTKPIAVMLNNVKAALPQSGNSQADILYEVPEEGGATRIMGLFQDLDGIEELGSIRSTRPYYVRLALSNDAILVHAGGSPGAYRLIQEMIEKDTFDDMDFLENGTNSAYNYYYRKPERFSAGYASEHTLFIKTDKIKEFFKNNPDKIETKHRKYLRRTHKFVEDATPANGVSADSINVSFSGYKSTTFDYDADSGKYLVSEFDAPYMDEQAGKQVSVENVIIVQTTIEPLHDRKGRVAVYLTGEGDGFFACNGKLEKIHWEKKKARYTYTFTDEDGNEVDLGIGKSFVCVLDKARPITVNGEEANEHVESGGFDLADTDELSDEDAE